MKKISTDPENTQPELNEYKLLEKMLWQTANRFEALVENSNDIVVILDMEHIFRYSSQSLQRILGYRSEDMIGRTIFEFTHPEDASLVANTLQESFQHPGVSIPEVECRIRHRDGFWNTFAATFTNLLDNPTVNGFVINCHDITARKQAEEQIKASLEEKEILLKEVYHRVKNNLQIVSSLLNLQAEKIEDQQALEAFEATQNRVRSMGLIHEKLYQTKDLARIDFANYVRSLVNSLFRSYQHHSKLITLKINTDDVFLKIDQAIPCGLIINELITNALKYAFPPSADKFVDQVAEIRIDLRINTEQQVILIVADNGVGFPQGVDFRNTESLGFQIVNSLAEQLDGTITLQHQRGTDFSLVFPKSNSGK